jgi:hypothetical protein
VHHGDGYSHKQAKRHKPLLLVGKPIVLKCERRSSEHLRCINEVKAVGFQIGLALIFIPLVLHLQSVYTNVTTRKRSMLPANARVERPRDNGSGAPRAHNIPGRSRRDCDEASRTAPTRS